MTVSILIPQLQDTIKIQREADTNHSAIQQSSGVAIPGTTDSSAALLRSAPIIQVQKKQNLNIAEPEKVNQIQPVPEKKQIREQWNSNNFLIQNSLTGVVTGLSTQQSTHTVAYGKGRPANILPHERRTESLDWLLGIFLFLVILFVWIRVFYSKFFGTLANALASYHLSVKMFEEKNIFLHRVSMVLDFIYIIVFSVFIFEILEYSGISKTGMKGINLFLLLFNILMIYTLLRVFILQLIGSLFVSRNLFAEYIHNTSVINKGLGIALFPVIIMGQYLPFKIIPVVLGIGVLVFVAGFLMKSFRSYQIIIRKDILLFYLILYLCTLEILPLLLGYKFVTSLIQNN